MGRSPKITSHRGRGPRRNLTSKAGRQRQGSPEQPPDGQKIRVSKVHKMLRLPSHVTFAICLLVALIFTINAVTSAKENEKPEWAKKDIRDFSDADMERLFDQWEEADEPLEPDELPGE